MKASAPENNQTIHEEAQAARRDFHFHLFLLLAANTVLALNLLSFLPGPGWPSSFEILPLLPLAWLFLLCGIPYVYYQCGAVWLAQRAWGGYPEDRLIAALSLLRREPGRAEMPSAEDLANTTVQGPATPAAPALTRQQQKQRKGLIRRIQFCLFLYGDTTSYGCFAILGGVAIALLAQAFPDVSIVTALLLPLARLSYACGIFCFFLEAYKRI